MIGGGAVGTRKALALHEAGSSVRVISAEATPELRAAASTSERLSLELREYLGPDDIGDAEIVVAATGAEADERIAADARELHRLIVVAGDPESGNFTSMSVHRSGPLAIGVGAGVPGAAVQIRDAIAGRFDSRYADALTLIAELRCSSLAVADSSTWAEINSVLVGEDFCERVENGTIAKAVDECR